MMANNCWYDMEAVSKSKDALERLVRIMKYEDPEFYLYRVFSAEEGDIEQDGEFYTLQIMGDVAWAAVNWVNCGDYPYDIRRETGAHFTDLQTVCRTLGVAVEILTEECGCQFSEHIAVDAEGNLAANESCFCAQYCCDSAERRGEITKAILRDYDGMPRAEILGILNEVLDTTDRDRWQEICIDVGGYVDDWASPAELYAGDVREWKDRGVELS